MNQDKRMKKHIGILGWITGVLFIAAGLAILLTKNTIQTGENLEDAGIAFLIGIFCLVIALTYTKQQEPREPNDD